MFPSACLDVDDQDIFVLDAALAIVYLNLAVILVHQVRQQLEVAATIVLVCSRYVPDAALAGRDSRCVGGRRRLLPVIAALYVDAVEPFFLPFP